MTTKRAIKARDRHKQREKLQKKRLRIDVPLELRTLKPSARRQMERERAPSLWIMPWIDHTHAGGHKGRVYPANSLLGLPTEIRQKIMYQSYSIAELERDVHKMKWIDEKPANKRRRSNATEPTTTMKMAKSMLTRFDLDPHQGKLVTLLSRRVGALSRVSPLLKTEMEHVSKRWQQDLETYLHRQLKVQLHDPKVSTDEIGLGWLLQPHFQRHMNPKQGQVVRAKERRQGKRVRARKCWYCTERHEMGDRVCPMARRAPGEWGEMTKRVGWWRGREWERNRSTLRARKVMFD